MQTFLDGPPSYIRYKLWVMQMTWILPQEGLGETKELVVKRMYILFRVCVCIPLVLAIAQCHAGKQTGSLRA